MSSYLCIKITKAKADICFAQKDVNFFVFFFFFPQLVEKLNHGEKKLYELTFKIKNVLIFLKIEVAANVISNMRIIL